MTQFNTPALARKIAKAIAEREADGSGLLAEDVRWGDLVTVDPRTVP